MREQDKSREQLLEELKKLRLQHESLTTTYQKDIENRQLVEEELRESTNDLQEKVRDLSLISEITSTFLELASKDNIYNFLGEKIHQLSGADYLMISEYHEQSKSVAVRQIIGISAFTEKILQTLGIDYTQVLIPVEDLEQQMSIFSRRKLYRVDDGLYGLTTGKVNKVVCKSIETLLGINEIVSTGFVWEGSYFGGVTLSFKKDNQLKNSELIQSIIDQASLALSRKYFEQSLIESEQRYQTLAKVSPVGIFRTDETGRTTYTNPTWNQISGLSEDDGKEHRWLHAVHPDDREKLEDKWKTSVKEQIGASAEFRFVHPGGSVVWVIVHAVPEMNTEGKIVGYVGTATDITERKQAEEKLRESEEKFKTIFNESPIGIELYDATGKQTNANKASLNMFGIPEVSEIYEFNLFDGTSLSPAKKEKLRKGESVAYQSAFNFEEIKKLQQYKTTRIGTAYFDYVITPLRDAERETINGYLLQVQDVTERKKAEEERKESEEKLQMVFNLMEEGMALNELVFDDRGEITDYKILAVNPAFERLTSLSSEQVIGMNATQIYGMSPEYINSFWKQHINDEHSIRTELFNEANQIWTDVSTSIPFQNKFTTIFTDVTKRKQAEEALRASEEKYRLLFDSNPHPMWVYDLNTLSFLAVNDAAETKYGYSKDEFYCMTIKDIRPEEDISRLLKNISEVREGIDEAGNWQHRKKDGTIIDVEIISHTLLYEGKHAELVLAQDITERNKANKLLRKSENQYKDLVEKGNIAIGIDDVDGNLVYFNEQFLNLFGYSAEEAKNMNHQMFVHPDDYQRVSEMHKSRLLGQEPSSRYEFKGLRKDGSVIFVELDVSEIFREDGKSSGTLSYLWDITERKRAEKRILQLSRAVEQSPVSIIITDKAGNIEYSNPKVTEITGYESSELIGNNPRMLSSGEKPKSEYQNLWETISAGKEWVGEFHNKKKNGEYFWELASISPIMNEKGEITQFVAVKDDITEQKKILQELIEAKEHAEESDRLKSAFLAVMSHELRTPLNAVIGFSGLIDEELPMDQITTFAQLIHRSGNSLLEIVEGILDLTLLESGQAKIKKERFSLVNFMNSLINMVREEQQNLDKQNLEIVVLSETGETPDFIYSDQEKLKQVMINLLKNALKFTLSGKIEFGVDVVETRHALSLLKFYVKDTGIGITENQKSIIFERFRQVDDAYTRKFGGTGIGLAISKQTVELLGGHIGVNSEPGKGSFFYFTIPYQTEPKKEHVTSNLLPTHTGASRINKLKILIAEDDDASAKYLQMMIKGHCKEIIWMKNGVETIEACRFNPDIDLILMDIQMPEMNGYEATRQIRQFNKDVVIIAQTAFALEDDREKALEAGCSDYISKPFRRDQLMEVIEKYF